MSNESSKDWWAEYNDAKKAELGAILDTFPEEVRKGLVCARKSLGHETYRLVLTKLAKKCFSLSAKDKGKVTVNFSFLSGGVLYGMSVKQIDDFLSMYSHDLVGTNWRNKKYRLGVIEMWNTRFRFYIDADFLIEIDDLDKAVKNEFEGVKPMFMKRVYQVVQSVMNQVFDKFDDSAELLGKTSEEARQDMLTLVVADASPRLMTKNRKLYVKHGHHFHWPKITVTADTALALHQAIVLELSVSPAIAELQAKFGYKFEWKNIMDDRPYRDGKSLRLVGSCKPDKCAICEYKNPRDPQKKQDHHEVTMDMSSQCLYCDGKPRMTEPYLARKVVTYNGSYNGPYLKMLYDKPSLSVQLLSVSYKEGDPEPEPNLQILKEKYNVTLTLGMSGITHVTREKIAKTKHARTNQVDDNIRQEINSGKDAFKSIEDVPEELQAQILTLAKHVENSYSFNCGPWKVKKMKIGWRNFGQGVKDVVYYLFTDCHFCMNLGGCHSNKTIYFEATSEGIAQRCTCKCDTIEGRAYGRCCDYTSTRDVGIPTVIFEKLFFPVGFGRHETAMATNTDELDLLQFIRRINVCRTTTFNALKREKEMREQSDRKRQKFTQYKLLEQ